MNKKIIGKISALSLSCLLMFACTPTAPSSMSPDGEELTPDKSISGEVTGSEVGEKTIIAVYGHFNNLNGNKINAKNKTIDNEETLAVAKVADGKYEFGLPKGPPKANTAANLEVFAFNDDNGNNEYDENEMKSEVAKVRWVVGAGYVSGKDADGNEVPLSKFEDFDFKLEKVVEEKKVIDKVKEE